MTGTWLSVGYHGTRNPAALCYSKDGSFWWILKGNADAVYDPVFLSTEPGRAYNSMFYASVHDFPYTFITSWADLNTGTNWMRGNLGPFSGWLLNRSLTVP